MRQPVKVFQRCEACAAREQCIFGDLPAAQVEAYRKIRHFHAYAARQSIHHEETPALGFHIVCSGRVKLSRANADGREQILRIIGPGEIVGEESLLGDGLYIATAEALEPCQTAFIQRDAFLEFLEKGRGVATRFLLHFCRMLIDAQIRLVRIGLGDGRERLAALLVDLGQRYGQRSPRGLAVDIGLSRAELAAMVGLSPETAMRLLSQFKADGLVGLDRRRITLLKPETLRSLAG